MNSWLAFGGFYKWNSKRVEEEKYRREEKGKNEKEKR